MRKSLWNKELLLIFLTYRFIISKIPSYFTYNHWNEYSEAKTLKRVSSNDEKNRIT